MDEEIKKLKERLLSVGLIADLGEDNSNNWITEAKYNFRNYEGIYILEEFYFDKLRWSITINRYGKTLVNGISENMLFRTHKKAVIAALKQALDIICKNEEN